MHRGWGMGLGDLLWFSATAVPNSAHPTCCFLRLSRTIWQVFLHEEASGESIWDGFHGDSRKKVVAVSGCHLCAPGRFVLACVGLTSLSLFPPTRALQVHIFQRMWTCFLPMGFQETNTSKPRSLRRKECACESSWIWIYMLWGWINCQKLRSILESSEQITLVSQSVSLYHGNGALFVLFILHVYIVCTHVCKSVWMCMHTEIWEWCQNTLSIAIHLVIEAGSPGFMGFVPGIPCLCLPSSKLWITGRLPQPQVVYTDKTLGIWTQVLMFSENVLLPSEVSPEPLSVF